MFSRYLNNFLGTASKKRKADDGFIEIPLNPYPRISAGVQRGNFIHWADKIEEFRNTQCIMIRDCYPQIYELILGNLPCNNEEKLSDLDENQDSRAEKISFQKHLVTGVPGIGKSNFSLYVAWRYIQENPDSPLLFESTLDRVYYLTPAISYVTTRMHCLRMKFPYLVDFAAHAEPDRDIGSFTIVFSSPDPRRFKEFMKDDAIRYVMPVWTSDELSRLNGKI